jgi:polar amino acid transport system permease protein
MATIAEDTRLGPFAPDARPPIRLARASLVLGIVAASAAAFRPVFEALHPESDLAWARSGALAIGVLAAVVSLVAFYRVTTHGLRGRGMVLAGVWLGAAAAMTAVVYGATADGTLRLGRFFHSYFNPSTLRAVAPDLARGALNTLKAASLAEVIAIGLGLVFATFRMSRRRVVRLPAVVYIDVVRSLPLIVLASLVTFGLPAIGITLGTLAAVVTTLVINASAYVAEIFRAGIQSLPRGQMDAARSLGMTQGTAMISVVIPQAVRAVIPPLLNELIALIKDTAIAYFVVGVTVSTRDMFTAAQSFSASCFCPAPLIGASIGYLIIVIPLTRLVGYVERRAREGLA